VGTSVIITHSHRIDSLNLPIAASIALYEATKKDF
jgi:TrmH family RNA methyltransferase